MKSTNQRFGEKNNPTNNQRRPCDRCVKKESTTVRIQAPALSLLTFPRINKKEQDYAQRWSCIYSSRHAPARRGTWPVHSPQPKISPGSNGQAKRILREWQVVTGLAGYEHLLCDRCVKKESTTVRIVFWHRVHHLVRFNKKEHRVHVLCSTWRSVPYYHLPPPKWYTTEFQTTILYLL
jgi:hypothetical protein